MDFSIKPIPYTTDQYILVYQDIEEVQDARAGHYGARAFSSKTEAALAADYVCRENGVLVSV